MTARLAAPQDEQKPVRREDALYSAVVLARAANQAMFLFADVSWGNGWVGEVGAATVTIKQDGRVVISLPIYEAARMRLETDQVAAASDDKP